MRTPGPYRRGKGEVSKYSVYSHDGTKIVAECGMVGEDEESLANAILFCAAHDMLEALKEAHPHIADDEVRARVGAAIVKAEATE